MICYVLFKCFTTLTAGCLIKWTFNCIVLDGETSEGAEKISLKDLYKMFQGVKSHWLVSLQFLCALDIFFGWDAIPSKNALTELYYDLSYETLSGGRNFNFEAISDLVADMSSQTK